MSRFFLHNTLTRKENEENFMWPGMTCNITFSDGHFTSITNALGQSFVWGNNIPLAGNTLRKPFSFTLTADKIVGTDNSSILIQSISGKWLVGCHNNSGQLKSLVGHSDNVYALSPLSLPKGERIKTVITNSNSIFIQSINEKWFVDGDNSDGQLGLGHTDDVHTPAPLLLPNGKKIKTVITKKLYLHPKHMRAVVCLRL